MSDISPKIIHMPIIVFVHVCVINDFWRLRTLSAWRKERLGSTRIARGIVPNKKYTTRRLRRVLVLHGHIHHF